MQVKGLMQEKRAKNNKGVIRNTLFDQKSPAPVDGGDISIRALRLLD